jgi:diguanylate cyclase (GGDEF)-like protein
VTWVARDESEDAESERNSVLVTQLKAMRERLRSMFETASDLIGSDQIEDVLAKITDRAAVEIRAPRHLLAVRTPEGGVHCHHRGFSEEDADGYAQTILDGSADGLPDWWLVVPVRSSRHEYGRLLALYDEGHSFFAEERELLEVYARYAASALDSATSLAEAERRYGQSSALLGLARALAGAGTSEEIAARLSDAVSVVVDCDRVGVYLWDAERRELIRRATTSAGAERPEDAAEWSRAPSSGGPLERLLRDPRPEPIFIDADCGDQALRDLSAEIGAVASIMVPLTIPGQFLGLVAVSVMTDPARLEPTSDLLDRLSGVAAQATTALQNGRLVDEITHQALHDGLTGLSNRLHFADELRRRVRHARQHDEQVTVFYLDLDGFKPVNDRYGHDAGDQLLRQVGQRLQSFTRSTDVVARIGGDEFTILVDPQTSPEGVDEIAERIEQAFTTPFAPDTLALQVGASVGRATFPVDATDAEQLLRRADTAMFDAKRASYRTSSHPAAYR